MKVFISWSGSTGKAVAEVLYAWLPRALQAVRPFFSPDDIEKGARWSSAVGSELEACQVGIVVITRESMSAPWIMFEAGALSRNVGKSKVVPLLFDLDSGDLPGPLMQFQSTRCEAIEVKRLLRMLNSELGDLSVTDNVLESAFSMWWPALRDDLARISRDSAGLRLAPRRSEREVLEEILALSRSIAQHQSEPAKAGSTMEPRESPLDSSGALTPASVRLRLTTNRDLVGTNLMGLDLAGVDLSRADLRGANLVGTSLAGSSLAYANLEGANLESAVLDSADLNRATIARSNLWHASLKQVRNLAAVRSMEEANFYETALDPEDRAVVDRHRTLDVSNYPDLFRYFLEKGMTQEELRELFLWTAHSYPGIDF